MDKRIALATNGGSLAPTTANSPLEPSSTRWLVNWNAMATYSMSANAELKRDLFLFEAMVEPANARAFAVALAKLMEWIVRYGIVPLPDDPEQRRHRLRAITEGYRADLASLPVDLLLASVDHVIRTHNYRNLPLPAAFLEHASRKLMRRQALLANARMALKFGRWEPDPLPPTERVDPSRFKALLTGLRINLLTDGKQGDA